jgi:dipeptidyl aminopeptidase/acylaminoacyl peptidase
MVKGLAHFVGVTSAVLVGALATGALAGSPVCTSLAPADAGGSARLITARDLIELRDIGPVANGDVTARILTVSPDKRYAAFQIRQANLDANAYCLRMYVLDLKTDAPPRLVDEGGDSFHETYAQLGFAALTPPGYMPTITPLWSPDSQWIAYLRRDSGVTQVWRARTDGSLAAPVTRLDYDAEDFAWSGDGAFLIVSGRPDMLKARADIAEEGKRGYLYDDRFLPAAGNTPQPREPIGHRVIAVDIATGQVRAASEAETAHLSGSVSADRPKDAERYFPGPKGASAWTSVIEPDNIVSPKRLHVRWSTTEETVCPETVCHPIANAWWSADGRTLWFQHAGYTLEGTDIYRWDAGDPAPRRLLSTTDVLIGCDLADLALVCGYETATRPRRLARIDLTTGAMSMVFDPNPGFGTLHLGAVARLHVKNSFGIDAWGDLVLPPDHKVGQKHPLVVVQYDSRGFLRGGTGDDYPIQLMAANGLAVLSLQRPANVASVGRYKTWDDFNRRGQKDWSDRRSILSALDLAVDAAIATGDIDGGKLGLTGMSDGATTVQFALVNHPRFTAVATSSCCYEPSTLTSLVGPAISQWFGELGYPRLTDQADAEWRHISLVKNAARITTPILMQLNEHEYLGALDAHTALKELKQPVELYVFPDEYHVRWQPQHRLASYVRTVDWFRFWLQGQEDPDPGKRSQYERWRKLKP